MSWLHKAYRLIIAWQPLKVGGWMAVSKANGSPAFTDGSVMDWITIGASVLLAVLIWFYLKWLQEKALR